MKNMFNITKLYTHGSVFHADDAFSTALMKAIIGTIPFSREPEIIRTNDKALAQSVSDNEDSIVFAIGEGEYDHHQKDRAVRPLDDGYWFDQEGKMQQIPYCSFGLLWKDYGCELCQSEKAWKKIDRELVLPIDKADNGVERNLLSTTIGQFNPNWNEDCSDDARMEAFLKAVALAESMLWKFINRVNAEADAEETVLNSRVIDGNILVLDQYAPWQDTVIEQMSDILFVVYPSARGGFNVQTVPDAPGSFSGRKLFPTEWLGNPDKELGMTFCHPGNFLLSAETEVQAIDIARIAASR